MYKLFILLFTYFVSSAVHALQLTPSSYELAPAGSLNQHVFEVINDSSEIIAVQASVLTREWSPEQKELNNKTSFFEIFPAQMILKPGEKKGLRVRWKGVKKLEAEKSFRLIVNQLPVNFSKDQPASSMKTLHQVVGALYVTPKGAKPELTLGTPTRQKLVVNEKTQKKLDFLVFDVTNQGAKHILLSKAGLSAKGDKPLVFTPEHFKKLPTQNVLAGATLRVRLPWPKELGNSITAITLP